MPVLIVLACMWPILGVLIILGVEYLLSEAFIQREEEKQEERLKKGGWR